MGIKPAAVIVIILLYQYVINDRQVKVKVTLKP